MVIAEFEQEHSYFSGFELIKVVHPQNLFPEALNGKIVFYKNLTKPAEITDGEGKEVSIKSNNGFLYSGKQGDKLRFKFKENSKNILVWRACLRANHPRIEYLNNAVKKLKDSDQFRKFFTNLSPVPWKVPNIFVCLVSAVSHSSHSSKYLSIILKLLFPQKKSVEIIHPRENFSTGLADLSGFVKGTQDSIELEMEWTNTHKINLLGMVELASEEEAKKAQIEHLELESLTHSHDKTNKADLVKGKVELIPVQFLELIFPYKKTTVPQGKAVSFFLKSKGYYQKI